MNSCTSLGTKWRVWDGRKEVGESAREYAWDNYRPIQEMNPAYSQMYTRTVFLKSVIILRYYRGRTTASSRLFIRPLIIRFFFLALSPFRLFTARVTLELTHSFAPHTPGIFVTLPSLIYFPPGGGAPARDSDSDPDSSPVFIIRRCRRRAHIFLSFLVLLFFSLSPSFAIFSSPVFVPSPKERYTHTYLRNCNCGGFYYYPHLRFDLEVSILNIDRHRPVETIRTW